MNFRLCLSNEGDLDQLMSISAQARERYRSLPNLSHIADAPALSSGRFNICRVKVAVDDVSTKVVGFAAVRPLDGMLYLDNISVEAASSGRGIGDALLVEVRTYAASLGVTAVMLTTFRQPGWNGPWFRRHGFQPMPPDQIGRGLRDVLDRQGLTLDPITRETLWRLV